MRHYFPLLLLLMLCAFVPAQTVVRRPIAASGAITFPINAVIDNFNRANEGPPLSVNWSDAIIGGEGGMQVISNEARGNVNAAINSNWWNAATFGPNCEAYITRVDDNIDFGGVNIRIQSPGTAGSDSYYCQFYDTGSQLFIKRVDNGVETVLATVNSVTVGAGDAIGCSAIGTSIKLWWNDSGGGWVNMDTVTDATYGGSGNIGITAFSNTGTMDNFGGGTR